MVRDSPSVEPGLPSWRTISKRTGQCLSPKRCSRISAGKPLFSLKLSSDAHNRHAVKNKTYAALVVGSTLWCMSILAAPLFGLDSVYSFFSRICHQDPIRSWHVAGEPLAVCIRCSSIYFAFTASLWLGLKTSVRCLRLSILLMLCEFIFAR